MGHLIVWHDVLYPVELSTLEGSFQWKDRRVLQPCISIVTFAYHTQALSSKVYETGQLEICRNPFVRESDPAGASDAACGGVSAKGSPDFLPQICPMGKRSSRALG